MFTHIGLQDHINKTCIHVYVISRQLKIQISTNSSKPLILDQFELTERTVSIKRQEWHLLCAYIVYTPFHHHPPDTIYYI